MDLLKLVKDAKDALVAYGFLVFVTFGIWTTLKPVWSLLSSDQRTYTVGGLVVTLALFGVGVRGLQKRVAEANARATAAESRTAEVTRELSSVTQAKTELGARFVRLEAFRRSVEEMDLQALQLELGAATSFCQSAVALQGTIVDLGHLKAGLRERYVEGAVQTVRTLIFSCESAIFDNGHTEQWVKETVRQLESALLRARTTQDFSEAMAVGLVAAAEKVVELGRGAQR